MGTAAEHPRLDRELRAAEGEMLLVDKPRGWTSFDVVNKIRGLLHIAKIGHAGTLDPMATGLLIVCTGKRTKEIDQYIGLEKEYETVMLLGARTASFDSETPVLEYRSTDDVTEERLCAVLQGFVGVQMQIPPMWSAAKVGGKRLYKYARRGEEVERRAREVRIMSVTLSAMTLPEVAFTVVCSKGTYVRALVDEIGLRLGCGAHVRGLRRTRIGHYQIRDAVSIQDLIEYSVRHRVRVP